MLTGATYRVWNPLSLLLYIITSTVFFKGHNISGNTIFGHGPDRFTFIWYLAWWPWAIAQGTNPLITELAFTPGGYNLAWGTSVPTPALISAPLTLLSNATTSFNVLMMLAPALSAWCAFFLLRHLTQDIVAALVGGFLFGFSSYELGHLQGHLNLVLTFPVPLAVLLVVARFENNISRALFLFCLVSVLLLLFGCSTEIFASFCTLGACVLLIFLLCENATGRRRLLLVSGEIIVASSLLTLILLPFLLTMAAGASEIPGFVNLPAVYSTDVLNFIVPTSVTRLGRVVFQDVAGRFTGNISEQGAYLGMPLIALLLMFTREINGDRQLRGLMFTILVLVIATLGPVLQIAGWNTGIPLPWLIATYLPLIEGALPARFTLYISLATAVAASLWLSSVTSGRSRMMRLSLAALACLFLVPNTQSIAWQASPSLKFFEPASVEQVLGRQANVVILPYEANGPGMYWQMQSGFRFSQAGGYFGIIPRSYRTLIVLQLLKGIPDVGFEDDFSIFCSSRNVQAVVIGPDTPPALRDAVLRIGWPVEVIGGVQLVRVPQMDKP